jgi:hypothetical protein
MRHVSKFWMGQDDWQRLAWTDDPIDTVTVTGVLRLNAFDTVILHTTDEELCVLHTDEYAAQV